MDTGRARAMNNATFAQDKVKSFQYTLICHARPVKQRTNWKLGDGKCYFCKRPETHEHLFYYCEFHSMAHDSQLCLLANFGRPDVRPNSSRKNQAPSKQLLLRSLTL